jgi:hypothetical protein
MGVRKCIGNVVLSVCETFWADSGRREPTAENQRYCTGVTDTHGGLTPAALFGVRLCIAQIVFSPADVRATTQERGA